MPIQIRMVGGNDTHRQRQLRMLKGTSVMFRFTSFKLPSGLLIYSDQVSVLIRPSTMTFI